MKRKVCMLGTSAVGKTSLVARWVHGVFREHYLTTIGVKVDKRVVELAEHAVELVLWDLNGEDEFQRVRSSYLRGAAACLFVVDPLRPETLDAARELRAAVVETVGDVPGLLVLNKADLLAEWELDTDSLGECVQVTSAKTGAGVEELFTRLAGLMVGGSVQ